MSSFLVFRKAQRHFWHVVVIFFFLTHLFTRGESALFLLLRLLLLLLPLLLRAVGPGRQRPMPRPAGLGRGGTRKELPQSELLPVERVNRFTHWNL